MNKQEYDKIIALPKNTGTGPDGTYTFDDQYRDRYGVVKDENGVTWRAEDFGVVGEATPAAERRKTPVPPDVKKTVVVDQSQKNNKVIFGVVAVVIVAILIYLLR